MAKVYPKKNADPLQVNEEIERMGLTRGQRLPDGSRVVYYNPRKQLAALYPELVPLFQDERRFWKQVRKRTRNGEDVPESELKAYADDFKRQFNEILDTYENNNPKALPPHSAGV